MREKWDDVSKRKLRENIKKKINTTTIGSLAVFEEYFGECWGHGLHPDELDAEQIECREIWKEVRTKILDLGNTNLRAAMSELNSYSISWNRYVTNFKLKGSNDYE